MSKDYPFKVNEWQNEEIEIPTFEPVINKSGEVVGMKHGKRITTQRVQYAELSNAQKVTCKDFEHDWYIPDKHNHVAHCRTCTKRKFIRAIFEKVRDGKILDRDTLLQIG